MVGLEKRGYDAYRIGSDGATSHSVSGELRALVTRSPQAASQPNGKLCWGLIDTHPAPLAGSAANGLGTPPRAGFLCNSLQLVLLTINLIALQVLRAAWRCRARRLDDWARWGLARIPVAAIDIHGLSLGQ